MHDALLRTEPHAKSTIRLKQLETWLIRQGHPLPVLQDSVSIVRYTVSSYQQEHSDGSSASMSHESERTLNWPATYDRGIFRIDLPSDATAYDPAPPQIATNTYYSSA